MITKRDSYFCKMYNCKMYNKAFELILLHICMYDVCRASDHFLDLAGYYLGITNYQNYQLSKLPPIKTLP